MLTFGGEELSNVDGKRSRLHADQIQPLLAQICTTHEWELIDNHHIEATFLFDDFLGALGFVNSAGEVCEQENHHADFELGWGRAKVIIWTHDVDGLTESDFVLASKINDV
ncbi:MAG: pterin-4-alpha-carbinolamine dehydratase [Euryarchaeota archaeon]|nr:pterin-4-alpha-carbinolamine dehydratase [Euryarchaeota archaeon]